MVDNTPSLRNQFCVQHYIFAYDTKSTTAADGTAVVQPNFALLQECCPLVQYPYYAVIFKVPCKSYKT